MIVSTDNQNGIEISGLDICATETRSTVGINSLGVPGSSLHYEGETEKRTIIDDNRIRTTGLGMSSLGEIGSSLRHNGRLQHRQGSFKGLPTCFYIKSSILLCQCCILFF